MKIFCLEALTHIRIGFIIIKNKEEFMKKEKKVWRLYRDGVKQLVVATEYKERLKKYALQQRYTLRGCTEIMIDEYLKSKNFLA